MNRILIISLSAALSAAGSACSPIPELGAIQVADVVDAGVDGDAGETPVRGKRPDMMGGFSRDLGSSRDLESNGDQGMVMSPCPTTPGATAAFCYWPGGSGAEALLTALVPSGPGTHCTLNAAGFSVTAMGDTCTASFAPTVSAAWGFSPTKPIRMAFSYSSRPTADYAVLTVNIPTASMNEVIKVSGIAGSQNVLNLYSPAGVMFDPGFNLTLGGTATKATLTFDWISITQ